MIYKIFLTYILLTNIFKSSECLSTDSGDVWANTTNGIIKGRVQTTVAGTTFYTFTGIPFAEPPVNELRFKAPVPKKPWTGEWDSRSERGCCYQMTVDRPEETEDCLYLNIYAPHTNVSLPTMVFIYGGAFIEGYNEEINYGPHHLVDEQVIMASINYRVGPFGFFTTGDDYIPGNAGLKDQHLALKWIHENINHFGGDPSRITIFGQSAGAASVIYQVLSEKSQGLFSSAICESATALSPWAYQRFQKEISYALLKMLNKDFNNHQANSSEILQYLKTAPAKDIDKASHAIYLWDSPQYSQIQQGCFFAPVLEHEHEGAFVTKSMYENLKNGDFNRVPLLIGVNSEEMDGMADNMASLKVFAEAFDKNTTLLIPYDLNAMSDDSRTKVSKLIRDFYVPRSNFSANPRQLVKYFSHQSFARSILKHALLHSNYTDVYLYQFAYRGVLGGQTNKSVYGFSQNVRHGEEISYIMARGYGGLNTTDLSKYPVPDQIVAKRMIAFFTNFAKYSNPTPEDSELFQSLLWPKVKPNNLQYMDIGSYLDVKKNLMHEMLEFWDDLYAKYAVPPLITY